MPKKDVIDSKLQDLNQHVVNLHNRVSQLEWVLSNYIDMRGYQKKLGKFITKKKQEMEKEKENVGQTNNQPSVQN